MNPSRFNVTWDTPSETSAGSLPLGNGEIGVNVWLDSDGTVKLYLAKTDAWDEHGRLIKVGRAVATLTPNAFREKALTTLDLEHGEVLVRGGGTELTVFVDANRPVVWLEARGGSPLSLDVVRDAWRDAPRHLPDQELHCVDVWQHPPVASADRIVSRDGRQVWFHRNDDSVWKAILCHQGLGDFAGRECDPLLSHTFGASVFTVGSNDPCSVRTGIAIHSGRFADLEEWLEQLDGLVREACAADWDLLRREHRKWWKSFWERSHIEVTSTHTPRETDRVTAAYTHHRYLLGCSGRGQFPIKFNGSLFTADWGVTGNFQQRPEHTFDADYRRWGGAYWFQNTRLCYWPMLAAGDYECMQPLFQMYAKTLPLAEERSRLWFGHEGAFFPETMLFFGAFLSGDYGLNREGKALRDVENAWIGLQRCAILELLTLGLDYFDHTGDRAFLQSPLLDLARAGVRFYSQHYPRDAAGRLLLQPAQVLEAFWNARNPTPDLAGLHHVLPRLLALPGLEPGDRRLFQELYEILPEVPIGRLDEKPVILAAEELVDPTPRNSENPELYAVFPYRLFNRTRGLETGRWTFENRTYQETLGWRQDAIQAACLGLAATARALVLKNASTRSPFARFPGFFGPNIDWVPDFDHGGVTMIALQMMLLQTDGDKILLFPAWPSDWDVDFRLHAPKGTVVRARLQNGKLEELEITPPERARDVVNYLGSSAPAFS